MSLTPSPEVCNRDIYSDFHFDKLRNEHFEKIKSYYDQYLNDYTTKYREYLEKNNQDGSDPSQANEADQANAILKPEIKKLNRQLINIQKSLLNNNKETSDNINEQNDIISQNQELIDHYRKQLVKLDGTIDTTKDKKVTNESRVEDTMDSNQTSYRFMFALLILNMVLFGFYIYFLWKLL